MGWLDCVRSGTVGSHRSSELFAYMDALLVGVMDVSFIYSNTKDRQIYRRDRFNTETERAKLDNRENPSTWAHLNATCADDKNVSLSRWTCDTPEKKKTENKKHPSIY